MFPFVIGTSFLVVAAACFPLLRDIFLGGGGCLFSFVIVKSFLVVEAAYIYFLCYWVLLLRGRTRLWKTCCVNEVCLFPWLIEESSPSACRLVGT